MEKIAGMLKKKGMMLATAESCTGGLIGHVLTNTPGSSSFYEGGVISYSNALKMHIVGVKEHTLGVHGAVSRETAEEMAEGIRRKAHVDIGIATTGIAGPGGGTPDKPVGLVYIALSTEHDSRVEKHVFHGTRKENKVHTCRGALNLLVTYLEEHD